MNEVRGTTLQRKMEAWLEMHQTKLFPWHDNSAETKAKQQTSRNLKTIKCTFSEWLGEYLQFHVSKYPENIELLNRFEDKCELLGISVKEGLWNCIHENNNANALIDELKTQYKKGVLNHSYPIGKLIEDWIGFEYFL